MNYMTTCIGSIMLLLSTTISAQNFETAADDESIVYFVKYSKVASSIVFKYFDSDKCIGRFKGQGYFIYRGKPGEHIFWASKEFTNFITANLKAGCTYLVMVKASTGVFAANPVMHPVHSDDNESINKALKVIKKKDGKIFSDEDLANWNDGYQGFMAKNMVYFEKKVNEGAEFEHLSGDMVIPAEFLTEK